MKGKSLIRISLGILGVIFLWDGLAEGNPSTAGLFRKIDKVGGRYFEPGSKSGESQIVILSETDHDDPAVIKKRTEAFEAAGRGEFYVAFEGYEFDGPENAANFKEFFGLDPATSKANGLGDPFINSALERVGNHVRLYWSLKDTEGRSDKKPALHKVEFLIELMDNPLTRAAWLRLDKDDFNAEMVRALNGINLARGTETLKTKRINEFKKSPLWKMDDEFLRISKLLALSVIDDTEDNNNQRKYNTPNMAAARKLVGQPSNAAFETDFVTNVDVEWRREGFVKHAMQLYERANKDGKPLLIIVGASHAPGLMKILREHGLEVSVN